MLSRASRLAKRNVIYRADRERHGSANDDESRRDRWKAPGSEVSTFLFEEKKKEKSLPYAFNQHHPASRARAHGTHTYTYVLRTILTRETIHTKDYTQSKKKKEKHYNTIFTKCVLPPVPF